MKVKRTTFGEAVVHLDKSETRRLIEAADIIAGIFGVVPQSERPWVNAVPQTVFAIAERFGGQHLTEDGNLKEQKRRKVDPIDLGPDPPRDLTDEALPKPKTREEFANVHGGNPDTPITGLS
jgi:hypothetical protein